MRFLPDANILPHALRGGSPMHRACRDRLDQATSRRDTLLLADQGFARFPKLDWLDSTA